MDKADDFLTTVRWSIPGGRQYCLQTTYRRFDDWKETPLGPVNFGFAVFSPSRTVEVARNEG